MATAFGTTVPPPRRQLNMPQIQYSEKYYDDVYEYRYARILARRFPASLCAGFQVPLCSNPRVEICSPLTSPSLLNPQQTRRASP
tara:strand:+ start:71 stop:325 length:255 start_codon:yes stop_codon:yes gene_type:complete